MAFLIVGIGGFLGAVARYLVYLGTQPRFANAFPVATLAVNTLGCLLVGVLISYAERNSAIVQPSFVLLAAVGFLGSFTTFSAFGLETFHLFRAGANGAALLNVALNVLFGLAAVVSGHWIANKSF